MKKTFLTFTFILVACLSSTIANAQSSFSLRIGGAFPMGKFGDVKIDGSKLNNWALAEGKDYGGAGTGLMLGFQYQTAISGVSGLSFILSADGIWNPMNSDIKDWKEDIEEVNYEIGLPNYINIPVLVGVNYELPIADKIGLFCEAALGVDFRIITPITINGTDYDDYTDQKYNYELEYNYDMAPSFAFRLGAGLIFNNKFTIGIDYFALGSAKVKGKADYSNSYYGSESESFKYKDLSQNLLALRLGIRF